MASNSMTDTETTTTDNETAEVDTAKVDTGDADTAKVDTGATSTEPAPATGSAGTESAATGTATPASNTADPTSASANSGQAPTDDAAATTPGASGSFVTAALALVGAGLGLASLTGTSLGDMMRARQELLGQITAATGGQIDQIDALYGSPWSTVALVNGTFAVLAVILGAVLLGTRGRKAATPNWVKAVALGGTVLGVIGLLVSGGMYLDLFAAAPQLPTMPGMPG